MKLTPEEIEEFRAVHEKAFGESLTYDEAEDRMGRFVELYRVMLNFPPDSPPGPVTGHAAELSRGRQGLRGR